MLHPMYTLNQLLTFEGAHANWHRREVYTDTARVGARPVASSILKQKEF